MSQVLRISEYGRPPAEGATNGLGRGDATVSGNRESPVLHRGERLPTVTVAALSVVLVRNGSEQRFSLGPFTRGHEAHRRLRGR